MQQVRAKKHLGQHFLIDLSIAKSIVDALEPITPVALEIGPGMGVLTQYLLERNDINLKLVEIDTESVEYLQKKYKFTEESLWSEDFLRMNISDKITTPFSVIGNFPYNISSQIFFKVLEHKEQIPQVVGMLQKEVAERLAAPAGTRESGILSIFLQAYYDIEYLFTVSEDVFNPPPKVKSAVIRLKRNSVEKLDCDEKLFKQVVKATFNQRRKTIWNSIKVIPFKRDEVKDNPLFLKRPEQLTVPQFVELTNLVATHQ